MQVIDIDLIRIAMPFIAVFTITFSLLQVSKITGSRKGLNAIISIAMGLLFLRNSYLIEMTEKIGGRVALVIISMLILMLIVGLFAGKKSESIFKHSTFFKIFLIVIFLVFVFVLSSGIPGVECEINSFGDFWNCISEDYKKFIIFLAVIVGVFVVSFWTGDKIKEKIK